MKQRDKPAVVNPGAPAMAAPVAEQRWARDLRIFQYIRALKDLGLPPEFTSEFLPGTLENNKIKCGRKKLRAMVQWWYNHNQGDEKL